MKIVKILLALFLAQLSFSQTLSEFKPTDNSYGMGKLKKVEKRIYIAGFDVNYQIYNEKEAFKQGGHMLGGSQRGDAKAALSVGLDGLDEQTVQQVTDKLYADFIKKLTDAGFTIISADEAAKTDTYADYDRVDGGKINMAQIPGTLTATPTGYQYFVKGANKKGKEKKGGFLGNEAIKYPALGKALNDAIVVNVDLSVLFVRDQNAFQGNGVKLKVKTDLRLVARDAIMMTSDAAIKMKGQNTSTFVSSTIGFYHGKMGLGSTTTYTGSLKQDLTIGGVIDDATVTAQAKGSVDQGTKSMYYTYFSPSDGFSESTKIIPVDAKKYGDGIYAAGKKFLDYHTDEFLKSF